MSKFQRTLVHFTKEYFKGDFFDSTSFFSQLYSSLEHVHYSHKEVTYLRKMLAIFLLGHLLGLPTLKSILTSYQIKSTDLYRKQHKVHKKITYTVLKELFEAVFEKQILDILKPMVSKDLSIWSRTPVTAIIDDSVFRQWLSDANKETNKYYGKFYSGQYGTAVYGYQVVTFGLSIDGVFYPLYFEFVDKGVKEANEIAKSRQIAIKLTKKWGNLVKKLQKEGIELPEIPLSCDNGYSCKEIAASCQNNQLKYISVPKKSHTVEIGNKKWAISDYIKIVYLDKEAAYLAQQASLPIEERTPFTQRITANYCSQGNDIVLLFFRLNNSKKVSVIYSTNNTIHAKTLRRHWFQRTYIEQFFKCLKHTLKIQQAVTVDKETFESKLVNYAFLAWHLQKLIIFLRKKVPEFKKNGIYNLQILMKRNENLEQILEQLIYK